MHAWLPCARPKLGSAMCEPKIDQRASTNVRSQKKFVRENLKRTIFECSKIRCSSNLHASSKNKANISCSQMADDAITRLNRPRDKHSPRSELTPKPHRWIWKLTTVVVCTLMRGKHDVTQLTHAHTHAPRQSTAPRCISLFSLLFLPSTCSHQDHMSCLL